MVLKKISTFWFNSLKLKKCFFFYLNSAVSDQGLCLTNVPVSNGLNVYVDDKQPGQYLTADDQCKQIYGKTASFCLVRYKIWFIIFHFNNPFLNIEKSNKKIKFSRIFLY